GVCDASFVLSNGARYQCASWVNGRACTNKKSVRRSRIEQVVIDTLRADLSDSDMIAEVEKLVRQTVRAKPRSIEQDRRRVEQLRREVQNLTDAIAQGMLRSSGAIAQRLVAAETELERLEVAA